MKKKRKPVVIPVYRGYGFNRLSGEAKIWAEENQFAQSEFCVPVKDGRQFGGEEWQKIKCGNGRMGFSTRRKGQDEVRLEVGQDGQLKRKRNTLVRVKSARASATRVARRVDGSKVSLVSSAAIARAQLDPIVIAEEKQVNKKFKRARNRNNRARRGRR